MAMMLYYFSPDATLSADWLPDKLSAKQLADTELLLASACQRAIIELDDRLPKPIEHPFLPWATQSIHHGQWLLSYYRALIVKQKRVFDKEYRSWRLEAIFAEYVKRFPRTEFEPPPQLVPADCFSKTADEAFRKYFLRCQMGMGLYKKVRTPFWLDDYYNKEQT